MKTDIKFTVESRERAFSQEKTKTTEGRIEIERQQLEDELKELQQVEEQLVERVAKIREKLDLLKRVVAPYTEEDLPKHVVGQPTRFA